MNVQTIHSVVQDETVLKFNSLKDYFRCIEFLDERNLKWTPLTYSSLKDKASIRVAEHELIIITNRFGMDKWLKSY
ncbi:hypothetical protein XaC1_132 [Xanthomonas phage XaC1]|nr:hypothetical protein XaC1_132 [Xanthomonas phage XaC1]